MCSGTCALERPHWSLSRCTWHRSYTAYLSTRSHQRCSYLWHCCTDRSRIPPLCRRCRCRSHSLPRRCTCTHAASRFCWSSSLCTWHRFCTGYSSTRSRPRCNYHCCCCTGHLCSLRVCDTHRVGTRSRKNNAGGRTTRAGGGNETDLGVEKQQVSYQNMSDARAHVHRLCYAMRSVFFV